jgi:hypothetical protein
MNIGFDLDKIFINPPYISNKFIDRLYKHKIKDDVLYRIPSKAEQLFWLASHARTLRKPIKENLLFIENLPKKDKNNYYLITGRFGFLKKKTEAFIKKYNFDKIFDGMYFNYENQQPHHFKDTMIKHLHLDQYIDDDLDLLQYLAKNNGHTQFFWLNKKTQGKLLDNLMAITNLKQIYDSL